MKSLSLLLIFIISILSFSIHAQENLCFDDLEGSWWPIEPGLEFKYAVGNENKTSVMLNDSVQFDGKYYLIEEETYKSGKVVQSYWRTEDGAVYYYDKKKGKETMELPGSPEVGQKWKSDDGLWKYEVVSLNSSLKSPYCHFEDLLQVTSESSENVGVEYNLYYKRGVGLVGLYIDNKPFTYIIPDQELKERAFMAYGCEDLSSPEAIQNCTSQKIFEHISENINYADGFQKGEIIVNVIIGKDGNVREASILQGLPNAEAQENEVLRVIKSLPTFIPAQIDDHTPIVTEMNIPINF